MDLGATRLRTFIRVTGPNLLPAIAASAMLIFPWSFDDFVITYFVAGIGSTTLPIYVFSQLRFGATPVAPQACPSAACLRAWVTSTWCSLHLVRAASQCRRSDGGGGTSSSTGLAGHHGSVCSVAECSDCALVSCRPRAAELHRDARCVIIGKTVRAQDDNWSVSWTEPVRRT